MKKTVHILLILSFIFIQLQTISAATTIETDCTCQEGFKFNSKTCVQANENTACTLEFAPVCGCNGMTYSNQCFANADGIKKITNGECSSSSSGSLSCVTDTDCPLGVCSSSGTFKNYSCGDGICNQIFYFANPCEFQSPEPSKNFNGSWKGTTCKKCKKSEKITLDLCIKNKLLEGTINIPEYIESGVITSQNIISATEVKAIVENQAGITKEITFSISSKKYLNIQGADSNVSFNVKRSGNSKICLKKIAGSGKNKDGLSPDIRIRTTGVQKRIADIKKGELVLSDEEKAVRVKKVSKAPVKNYKILKVRLNDGTIFEVSPGHPTADGRRFKELKMGDFLDNRMVVETKLIPYIYSHTYDILPDSKTGNYYANGVLIGSTLK